MFFLTIVLSIVYFLSKSLFVEFLSIITVFITIFSFFFFRNPQRYVNINDNNILSPADGTIMSIEDDNIKDLGKVKVIRIFLSVLNVHIQRAPIGGIIGNIKYKTGKFLPAMNKKAHIENESNSVDFINSNGRIIRCVQIAGIIARRIVMWKNETDYLRQGDLYGMIKFGSQVDIYVPYNVKILIEQKQKIKAGKTVIAQW
jgi:phosphatidylserine decarboxylase